MSIATAVKSLFEEPETSKKESPSLTPLTPEVYAQLRMVAGKYMRGERAGHTLQATAIVNEAYIRLAQSDIKPEDQTHFFRLAAQAMRNILVDHARAKNRAKREAPTPEELGVLIEPASLSDDIPLDVLDIDRALTVLKQSNERIGEIFEQRYLLGQTVEELALIYNVSISTVERDLRFARAWLTSYCKRNPRSRELEDEDFLDDVADQMRSPRTYFG